MWQPQHSMALAKLGPRIGHVSQTDYAHRRLMAGLVACLICLATANSLVAHGDKGRETTTPPQTASAQEEPVRSFSFDTLAAIARALADAPYKKAPSVPRKAHHAGSYEDYRGVLYRPKDSSRRVFVASHAVEPLPVGWIYTNGIELNVIENGKARPVNYKTSDFTGPQNAEIGDTAAAISGFKVNGYLNTIAKLDEIIVFQGASYFRALAKGQRHGLSARGLAIGTASPKGEEFPAFRRFWIEKTSRMNGSFVIYALLDSESITGAYKFTVHPGDDTVIDIVMTVFPRRNISSIGLAPLTSMNFLSPGQIPVAQDFRPRVHDSQGLAVLTSNKERIWRPLINPKRLELSYFRDRQPSGFGLVQRQRKFAEYQDLEALYHLRPSAWIEFGEGLGAGDVALFEIPSALEVHDNIVAFWKPLTPLHSGNSYTYRYTLRWCDQPPSFNDGPWVSGTRIGEIKSGKKTLYRIVIDYVDDRPLGDADALPQTEVTTNRGHIENVAAQHNPETGGLRVSLLFDPEEAQSADIRLTVGDWSGRTPETLIYRWSDKS